MDALSRSFQRSLALSLILSLSRPNSTLTYLAEEAEQNLKLTIRVYNLAQVSTAALARAEKEVARIFREVGVKTVWLDCPLSGVADQRVPGCQPSLGPLPLNLRIIPPFPATGPGFLHPHLGFALPSKEGGVHASIFFHRVEKSARAGRASPSSILGHAVAHELGHLLLGSNSHSPAGLMRAEWSRDDLRRATLELLGFTPEQARLIREEVLRRLRQQAANQSCGLEVAK